MTKNAHWSRRHTKVTRQKLRERIGAYSVEPFADAIAFLLGCRPDTKAVTEWANKNPDKWANAISILSKLYGFAEYKVIDHNHHFDITKLSDMELQAKLTELKGSKVIQDIAYSLLPEKEQEKTPDQPSGQSGVDPTSG